MNKVDTLIQNALVFDGTSAEPAVQDLAVHQGKIVGIGPNLSFTSLSLTRAERVEQNALDPRRVRRAGHRQHHHHRRSSSASPLSSHVEIDYALTELE